MSESLDRTIHSIISHTRSYAKKRLNPEDLEDLVSFCVEYYLKTGRRLKPTYALAEFARKNLGRIGTARSNATAKTISIDDVDIPIEHTANDLYELYSTPVGRLIVFLVEKYGFTQRELAGIMRVHEARISQIIERSAKITARDFRDK